VVNRRLPKVNLRAESMQDFGKRFKEAIAGYKLDLETAQDNVNIMALDAATPGRLSICFYQEMLANDFIRRIEQWHVRGKWRQYKSSSEKGIPGFYYEGVPTPKRIIEECYGSTVSENKARAAMERIFHCIINGNPIPRDMVATIVQRVIRQAIKTVGNDFYDWERMLQVTCSMIRNYYYQKEVYNVALNRTITDRSYLYGRLLAVADWIERSTFDKETERLTNAVQYINAFSQRPSKTWVTIYNKLQPYQAKLGNLGRGKAALLDEIVASFAPEDFSSNKPLNSKFLLGYHSQRYAFQQEIKEWSRLKKEREAQKKENITLAEGE
jgi:CRISPR-associated protein Csd1